MRNNPQPPSGQGKQGRGNDPTGTQQDRQSKQDASRPDDVRREREQARSPSQGMGSVSREGRRAGTESGALQPSAEIDEDLGRQH